LWDVKSTSAKTPTPEQEDRRQISRERRSLTAERIEHVDRINRRQLARNIRNGAFFGVVSVD
jgi:hypothetical protein